MRTGKIGLKAFLHRRGVPNMETSFYNCNQTPETATHLAIEYQETTKERQRLNAEIATPICIRYDFDLALKDPLMIGKVTKWMLKLGHLYQYRLVIYIDKESEELQKAEMKAAKKNWKYNAIAIWETHNRIPPIRDTEGQLQTIVRQGDRIR